MADIEDLAYELLRMPCSEEGMTEGPTAALGATGDSIVIGEKVLLTEGLRGNFAMGSRPS